MISKIIHWLVGGAKSKYTIKHDGQRTYLEKCQHKNKRMTSQAAFILIEYYCKDCNSYIIERVP